MTEPKRSDRVTDAAPISRVATRRPVLDGEALAAQRADGITVPLTDERMSVTHAPGRPHAYARYVKPAMDRVIASLLLLVLAPVFLLTSAVVLLTLGRPLFYVQTRVGHRGAHFDVFKFRTMRPDRRHQAARVAIDRRRYHKRMDDPRHVPAGRLLRALHLDELPQLLNVLRGEMSLVGPRPELPRIVEAYEPWQHQRHQVRPGITGLWQVSRRGQPMYEHVDLDIAYIDRISFWTDVRLMLLTIPSALARRGQ